MIDLNKLDPSKFKSPVVRGDKPLTPAQFKRRIEAALSRVMTVTQREQLAIASPEDHKQVGLALMAIEAQAFADNTFNAQLVEYRAALARLSRYRLADGQAEAFEDMVTGEFDPETGEPLTDRVRVRPAIDPLPATIEQLSFDDEGNQTGTEDVPNPEIERDDAERAAAQAVIDNTPQEVIEFSK